MVTKSKSASTLHTTCFSTESRALESTAQCQGFLASHSTAHTGCTTAKHGAADPMEPCTAPLQPLKLPAPTTMAHRTAPSGWHHHREEAARWHGSGNAPPNRRQKLRAAQGHITSTGKSKLDEFELTAHPWR